jgi:hypothetical protein
LASELISPVLLVFCNRFLKRFFFRRSRYWSHDGYKETDKVDKTHPKGFLVPDSDSSPYVSQDGVWNDIGKTVRRWS